MTGVVISTQLLRRSFSIDT